MLVGYNIQLSEYEKEVEEMKHMTRQEYVASLRRYRMKLLNLLHFRNPSRIYLLKYIVTLNKSLFGKI